MRESKGAEVEMESSGGWGEGAVVGMSRCLLEPWLGGAVS